MQYGATGLRWLAAILLPVAAVLSHRNLPMVLALIGLAGFFQWRQLAVPRWSWAGFAFVGWAALTALWSPYSGAADWPAYMAALALILVGLSASGDARSDPVVFAAIVGTILLLGVEAATGGLIRDMTPPVSRPDKDDIATARGITEMLALAPAALLLAYRADKRLLLIPLVIALGWASVSFGIFANALAFVAAIGAGAFAYRWPKTGMRWAMIGAGLGFVVMPLFALALPPMETLTSLEAGPASWRMRLVIWKTIVSHLGDGWGTLVFGHGVEGLRVLGEQLGDMRLPGVEVAVNVVPTHAHNIYLQIWYDLGMGGCILALLALWQGAQRLGRHVHAPDMAAAVTAFIAMTVVFAAVDASLWTLWRVAGPILGAWALWRVTKRRFSD